MDNFILLDILVRGIAIGIGLLLAGKWLVDGPNTTARLGALFATGMAIYALISSPATANLLGPLLFPFHLVAVFGAVFFWWFVIALFEEQFEPKFWIWVPVLLLLATLPFRYLLNPQPIDMERIIVVHQLIVLSLLVHAVFLAIRGFAADLVEPRRRFRLAVATLIPAMGVIIVVADLYGMRNQIPAGVYLVHAIALLGLNLVFAHWALAPRTELFETAIKPNIGTNQVLKSAGSTLTPEDRFELERLLSVMEEGIFRQEELSIGKLGKKIQVPEHRLRKLINQGLGFRNFSAFLNSYRLGAARNELADPAKARTQITVLALDLGYGSIGPFNRAFKQAYGITPTEFRKATLAKSEKN